MDLSLKYKAKTFDEIVGHTKTVKDLRNRSLNKNYSKVVLFTGLAGTGKSRLANIYTKILLCKNINETGNPCNNCSSCKLIDTETNTEYLHFYNGGEFGVDEAKQLISLSSKKILGKKEQKKIFVIDELQSIKSTPAKEKLFKVLEKDYDNCYYILGAMRWENLGTALKRRSTRYHLSLSYYDIGTHLNNICIKENVPRDENFMQVLKAITHSCEGSLGLAISYLERVISSEIRTEQELIDELNIMTDDTLNNLIIGILNNDMSIFGIKFSEDILRQIEWKILFLYKRVNGCKLNKWQSEQISIFPDLNSVFLENIIMKLNELKMFPYLTSDLIEFTLIKIMLENKKLSESLPSRPARKPRK